MQNTVEFHLATDSHMSENLCPIAVPDVPADIVAHDIIDLCDDPVGGGNVPKPKNECAASKAKVGGQVDSEQRVVLDEIAFERSDNTIDIVSFDIGTVRMGVTRVRYDYQRRRLCILYAMLLNIYHPYQVLNCNDQDSKDESTFKVKAYQHTAHPFGCESASQSRQTRAQLNAAFSQKQSFSRKRALIVENSEQALQFYSARHPPHTKKRREAKFAKKEISKALAKGWVLDSAQLVLALNGHDWISGESADGPLDFCLLEQQDPKNIHMRALCMSVATYYETRRQMALQLKQKAAECADTSEFATQALRSLRPIVKICSSSNKLAHGITDALHTRWSVSRQMRDDSSTLRLTAVQIRALCKKYFSVPSENSVANSENYSKRKISSVAEITRFFCRPLLEEARSRTKRYCERSLIQTNVTPNKCPEAVVESLARSFPVGAYAHWLVNQQAEKNNITDALLQVFSWIEQAAQPHFPNDNVAE